MRFSIGILLRAACFSVVAAVLPLSIPARGQAVQPSAEQQVPASASLAVPVKFFAGAVYPSMRPFAEITVFLNADAVADEVADQVQKGWDCTNPGSFTVTAQGSTKPLRVETVRQVGKGSCKDTTPDPVLLLILSPVDTSTAYVVSLSGLPDGKMVQSPATKFSSTAKSSFSLTPQAVPGEAMNNGAKRDVGQMNVQYSVPFIGRSPLLFNTRDVFSTDAEDAKSAWAATLGLSHGLFKSWYTPLTLTETMQGNQAASNVSAVTNLSISGLVPWFFTRRLLNNPGIDAGAAPEFAISGAYTRRIEQIATSKTTLLATDDASINSSVTIAPWYLLPGVCTRYQAWIKSQNGGEKGQTAATSTSGSRQFCLAIQPDLGVYYLPLDHTKTGSQQVEGYGDVSILIPLSNLNFKKFQMVSADGLLNSQIHIKWSDSVNAANNYARTRQWTFGIEVMK
jgi:hypothetical protein